MLPHVNKLLLLPLTAVLLASCGGGTTTPPAPKFPAITSLSGTVVESGAAWTGGVGTVTLFTRGLKDEAVLASTTLNADGSFSFASLPTPDDASLDVFTDPVPGAETCTDNRVVSDPNFKSTGTSFVIKAQKNGEIGLAAVNETAILIGDFIYSDRSVTIKGELNCPGNNQTYINSYDFQLVKGWNQVVFSTPRDDTTAIVTFSNTNGSPSGAQWEFFERTTTPACLKANHFLR